MRRFETLARFGKFEPATSIFADSLGVELSSDTPHSRFFYTLHRTTPDESAHACDGSILLHETTTVTAIAISATGKRSIPVTRTFRKAKHGFMLLSDFAQEYSGGGEYALVDGVIGSTNFKDGRWQGYEGTDLVAVLDLGKTQPIGQITLRCLSATHAYIFLPKAIECAFSKMEKRLSRPSK